MTTYYISRPVNDYEINSLEDLLDGLESLFKAQRIEVIGIVTDDPRLDAMLRSLAKDVVGDKDIKIDDIKIALNTEELKAVANKLATNLMGGAREEHTNEQPIIIGPPGDNQKVFRGEWVSEALVTEPQIVEDLPTETKTTEEERACVVCGNPVPKGRRSPTCSQKCYMKNYWETHKGNGKSSRPRKQRGVKASKDNRTGDGVVHGKLHLGQK